MYLLTGDNESMWDAGRLMGIFFFAVITILGIVIYLMVARGSSKIEEAEEEEF